MTENKPLTREEVDEWLQAGEVLESTVAKESNFSTPENSDSTDRVFDSALTGDSPVVRALNQYVNNMSVESQNTWSVKAENKTLTEQLKIAEKLYKDERKNQPKIEGEEEPQLYSIKDVPGNAVKDASRIILGAGALAAGFAKNTAYTIFGNPEQQEKAKQERHDFLEQTPEMATAIVENMGETIGRNPETGEFSLETAKQKWYREPIGSGLDVLTVVPVLGPVGRAIKTAGYAKTGQAVEAIAHPTKIPQFVRDVTKPDSSVRQFLNNKDIEKAVHSVMETKDFEAKVLQSKQGKEIERVFGELKKFSDSEYQNFSDVVMGLKPMPDKPSTQLTNAVSFWKTLNKDNQTFLLENGFLTVKSVDRAKWIPILAQKYGRGIEDISSTAKGISKNKAYINDLKDVLQVNEKGLLKLINEVKKEIDITPEYFPQYTTKAPKAHGNVTKSGTKLPKQPFQKRKTGRATLSRQYETDPIKALTKHTDDVIRLKKSLAILDEIKNMKDPLTKEPLVKELISGLPEDGWRIFDPDNYKRLLRTSENIANGARKGIEGGDDVISATGKAIKQALPDIKPDGADLTKLFQIREDVAKLLESYIPQKTGALKYTYHKLSDYWKSLVLYLRPKYYVNQAIGNLGFYTVSGGTPAGLVAAAIPKFRKLVPEEARITAFHTNLPKIQVPNDSNVAVKFFDIIENNKVAYGVSAVREWLRGVANGIDNYFREAKFLDEVIKETSKQNIKSFSKEFGESILSFNKIKHSSTMEGRTKIAEKAVNEVEKWMGNYKTMSPLERAITKNYIPFYAFIRQQTKVLKYLAIDNPVRGKLIDVLSQLGELTTPPERRDAFREGKIYLGTDENGNDRYLNTEFANPLNMFSGFGMGVLNPFIQYAIEFGTQAKLGFGGVGSRKFYNPFVFEIYDAEKKTNYYAKLTKNGLEKLPYAKGPLEYLPEKFIPQWNMFKQIWEATREKPETITNIKRHREIPELLFHQNVMSIEMRNPDLDKLYNLQQADIRHRQLMKRAESEPALLELIEQNPDVVEDLYRQGLEE